MVGSFWWRDVCSLMHSFRGILVCSPHNCLSVLFWKDNWCDPLMAHKFSRLFSHAISPYVSLAELLGSRDLREPAVNFAIRLFLSQSKFLLNCKNWRCFSWSSIWIRRLVLVRTPGTGILQLASTKLMFAGLECPSIFKKIWKRKCMPKLKVFIWLLLVDRLNTHDMLDRRH